METSDENKAALMMGMTYLLNISFVESDEVLKICLDYWNVFVADVYSTLHSETSLQFFHQQQASDVGIGLCCPLAICRPFRQRRACAGKQPCLLFKQY